MKDQRRVLLLIGSPRGQKSTSASLGTYLLSKMHEKGFETSIFQASKIVKSDTALEEILSSVDDSDVIVIAFPLYVDAVPFPVVKLMENIAAHRKDNPVKRPRMLAVVNSGFPEAHHSDTALAICRQFAKEAGIEWVGGLALGGGHVINGQPLDKRGGLVKDVRKSLDSAADALVNDRPLPAEAEQLMSKPLLPEWLYLWMGEAGGKRTAKRNGVLKKINDRPYCE